MKRRCGADLWDQPIVRSDVEQLLAGSWAGDVLARMKAHHDAREKQRLEREAFEGPEGVRRRREERQQRHRARLEAKRERDRQWHERHGK